MKFPVRITKVLGTTALALAAGLAFTARAGEPGKLLIWINGDKGYRGLQKVGNEFTKKTGVKVVVEHPEDAPGKFQAAAEEGKGPDIWIWAHDRVGEWADSGVINAACHAILGKDYGRRGGFHVENCSITEVTRDRGGRLVLARHNDVCHLAG